MTNIQSAPAINGKDVAPVVKSPKTQEFRDALRFAAEPELERPVQSSADAKGEKKGHEEKKEHPETANSSGALPAPEIVSSVVVPVASQTAADSATGNAIKVSTPAPSEAFRGRVDSLHAELALDFPGTTEDVEKDSLTEAAPAAVELDGQAPGITTTDGSNDKGLSGYEKTDHNTAPAGNFNPMLIPGLAQDAVSEGTVHPLRDVSNAAAAGRTTDAGKQMGEVSRTETQIPDAVTVNAAVQMPLPIQEVIAAQITPNRELSKGPEVSGTEVIPLVAGRGSSGGKGTTATGDLRGKREDAKALPQDSEQAIRAQLTPKTPGLGVAIDFSSLHAGTSQGGGLAIATQTAGPSVLSADLSRDTADSKDASSNSLATVPTQPAAILEAELAPALNSAHLVQSIHQSEMKLGMNSVEFGSISISTTVSHQSLSTQISLDHPELSRVLSSHLSAVEERLGQAYGLQAKVEVRDGGTGSYEGTQQQAKENSQSSRIISSKGIGIGLATNSLVPSASTLAASTTLRLDIRI